MSRISSGGGGETIWTPADEFSATDTAAHQITVPSSDVSIVRLIFEITNEYSSQQYVGVQINGITSSYTVQTPGGTRNASLWALATCRSGQALRAEVDIRSDFISNRRLPATMNVWSNEASGGSAHIGEIDDSLNHDPPLDTVSFTGDQGNVSVSGEVWVR